LTESDGVCGPTMTLTWLPRRMTRVRAAPRS
jgi:hypothetical protein